MIYTAKGTLIELAPTSFAKGGEGKLYHVQNPSTWKNCVAKIYYPQKRTTARAQKLTYLVQNPLHFQQKEASSLVAWPLELLYEEKNFIGFLMPMANGELLEVLAAPKLPRKLAAVNKWKRFDFRQSTAFALRQKVCFNIAVALQHIHATGKYVMVDLKPENILIQSNGLVSLVDMDSIQIVEEGKQLFSAAVATPEFAPPEFHHDSRSLKVSSWDEFSLAIIFYKILLGIHPFAATAKGKYEKAITLGEKIAAGLYVQDVNLQPIFRSIPPPHQVFDLLDSKLKNLFNSCFIAGKEEQSLRPSAEDWCLALGGDQMTRPYFELPLRQFILQLPNLADSNYTVSFEEYWENIPVEELDKLILRCYQTQKKEHLILILIVGIPACLMVAFWSNLVFGIVFSLLLFCLFLTQYTPIQLRPQSKDWQYFYNKVKKEQKKNYIYEKGAWQQAYLIRQKQQDQQQQKWEKIWLVAEKECLQLNQEKLAALTSLQLTRNTNPIWQKYEGKNLFQKLAFLEQEYLPKVLADAADNKAMAIEKIEKSHQQDWEVLEHDYHQQLKEIEQKYSHNNTQKIKQKEQAEISFLEQRQLIIEAIAADKAAIEKNYLSSKETWSNNTEKDKNTLKELSSHYKEQQQWINQHYQSKFRNLLARLEVDFHQVQEAITNNLNL